MKEMICTGAGLVGSFVAGLFGGWDAGLTTLVIRSTRMATAAAEKNNQVLFKVLRDATKPEIKAAIETIYKVKVKAVNTSVLKGKVKRFKGILGTRSDIKKAIVTLEAGQQIDVTASV